MNFCNGDVYKGPWVNGKFNGFGEMHYFYKDKYCGNYVNGIREGKGTL